MKRRNIVGGLVLAISISALVGLVIFRKPSNKNEAANTGDSAHHGEENGPEHKHDEAEHKHDESGHKHDEAAGESPESGHKHDGGQESGYKHGEEEGVVKLSSEQIAAAGLEITTATPGILRKELTFPAEVKLNADNVAHIFPRYSGVVRQVFKAIGDSVKKGETLAIIESNESLTNYQIRSLVDGTVIERHVTLGETIRADAECFVVADLNSVWVDINIYPKDLALVHKGNAVRISATNVSHEGQGKITYIGPVVSEHTRTALARVVLPNPDNLWRPGIFVSAHVMTDEINIPLLIAKEALQMIGGTTVVFTEDKPGVFRTQIVKIGRRSEKEVEIVAGLKEGIKYVSKGTFILKAELGKSEAGHTHE